MDRPARVMMIGAHPDDCDFRAGATSALWRQAGMAVLMVSATNGDAGHHEQGGGALARRRAAEAKAAGAVIDIDYVCLDFHDGELVPGLEQRRAIIRAIREFAPDLLLTHRPGDYHADHRYTSQLVQDASFLLTVPNLCPDVPALYDMPVIMHFEDGFSKPEPFAPDVVVGVDATIGLKGRMADCHVSQFYEWLPWLGRYEVPESAEERLAWCAQRMAALAERCADRFRDRLIALYGQTAGAAVRHAEAFAITEYGAPLTDEKRALLFPFVSRD